MATKLVNFDFYAIDYSKYEELAKRIKSNDGQDFIGKTIKYKYKNIRLESWRYEDGIVIGTCTKLNMHELPYSASMKIPGLKELGLSDDEGVANLTGFSIIPEHRTIIIQRSKNGVRPGAFLSLLENITKMMGIEASIMVDQQTLKKLRKMSLIKQFIVKIANPSTSNAYKDISVREAANLAGNYQ